MSVERIRAAVDYFFAEYLTAAQRQRLQREAATVDVRLGRYARSADTAVGVIRDIQRTPRYAVEVGASSLPMAAGVPTTQGATFSASGRHVHLLWLREVADIRHDTEQEIRRIMGDLDHYLVRSGSGTAAQWAAAIANHPQREALTSPLLHATEVPEQFRPLAANLGDYRQILSHFFTFRANGTYYGRWQGAGRTSPQDLAADYLAENIVELQLQRDEVYLYAVLPARFLDGAGAADSFREVVWGFQFGGAQPDTPVGVRVVYTVAASRPNTGDYWDFLAFHADEGLGAPLAVSACNTVDAGLADFLAQYDATSSDEARRRVLIDTSPATTSGAEPYVRMLAELAPGAQLPATVKSLYRDGVTPVWVPPAEVAAFAAREDVLVLQAPRAVVPLNDEARAMTHIDQLDARVATAHRGGAGCVVGIIDSGIDGNHPSFGNRIIGVWEQGTTTGPSPASRMNRLRFFDVVDDMVRSLLMGDGTEYVDPTLIRERARDKGAHGTHVAGTAAGQAVTGSNPVPSGLAPAADIIAVQYVRPGSIPVTQAPQRTLGDALDFDMLTAAAYIIERAKEARPNKPVVINISQGHQDHPHDATDVLSRAMDRMAKTNGEPTPGVVFVAAAGNDRSGNIHLQRSIAARATQTLTVDFNSPYRRNEAEALATIWITNPGAAGNTRLNVRLRARSATNHAVTTATRSQRVNHSPHWERFPGAGVNVALSFGPPDAKNKDFNLRVLFRSAIGLIPDAAGPLTIGTQTYRAVALEPDWTVAGVTPPVSIQSVGFPLTLSALEAAGVLSNWEVTLENRTTSALDMHAWCGRMNASFVGTQPSDIAYLVGAPACAPSLISVAACVSKAPATGVSPGVSDTNPEGAIASFSSPGPLRKQPTNPGIDITAPGAFLVSARSAQSVAAETASGATDPYAVNTQALRMSGTSMASPVVAGIIANILAEEPTLTVTQIRARLAACAIPTTLKNGTTPLSGPATANDWGKGLINANLLKPTTP